jgi:prevent-host-death family protein
MLKIAASEFAKRFSQYRLAAQREPVAVTHHGRVTEVLLSKRDYDELRERAAAQTPSEPAHGFAGEPQSFRGRLEALRGAADAGLSTDEIMALTRGEA